MTPNFIVKIEGGHMIVAAYAGCGKTTFASKVWNSIDMVCVPYKYIVTDELEEEDAESKKGSQKDIIIYNGYPFLSVLME